MRALIDILKDEKNLITEIDNIDRLIIKKAQSLEEVKAIPVECPAKENDIRVLNNRIGDLYVDKDGAMTKLENIRNELKEYISTLQFGEVK